MRQISIQYQKLLILLFCFLFVYSCKKDDSVFNETIDQTYTTSSLAGFGDRPGTPSGTPFQLPYKVLITTPMLGFDTTINSISSILGVGNIFAIFTLENYNAHTVTVTFPAGLIFLPDNDSSQNGMTVHPASISLEPFRKEKILLKFFCINHNKIANYVNYYTTSVISNNDQVVRLIDALSVKSDSTLNWHTHDLETIVWNISDFTGLTQANLDSIKNW